MEATKWARQIEEMGLAPLVVPLLEVTRALGFVAAHALLLGQPLLVGIVDEDKVDRIIAWLEEPEGAEQLLQQLNGEEKRGT